MTTRPTVIQTEHLSPAAAQWLADQQVDALLIAHDAEPIAVAGAGTTTWDLLSSLA